MAGLSLLNIFFNAIPSRISDNGVDILYTVFSQILCMGIIPFVGALIVRKSEGEGLGKAADRLITDYRYRQKLPVVCWLLLLPLAISFYFVTRLFSSITVLLLTLLQYTFPISAGNIYTSPWDLIAQIALTAMLPAVFEEFTHRGLLIDAVQDRGSEASVIVWSGFMFALMHSNILQFFFAFAGGCIFAFLVVRSGSIIPAMILHFTNNALATVSEYASQNRNGVFGVFARINDFWYSSVLTSLLFGVLLVANMFLFLFLVVRFVKHCPQKEMVKPLTLIRGSVYVDRFRPDGKPTLRDNVFLYATIAMTGLMTAATYLWGLLR